MTISRRSVLKFGATGAVLTAGGLLAPFGSSAATKSVSTLNAANFPKPWAAAFAPAPVLRGRRYWGKLPNGTEGEYRLITVKEKMANASIVPGLKTPVYGYAYIDDQGIERPVRVPGPTIKVDHGTPVKLRVCNQLPPVHPQFGHPFATSTHLHGSASLPQYDGYADDQTLPGDYKDYWYPNFQDARTLWYHDHGVHHTAKNAYGGLAAQYHLHDKVQERLLPKNAFDVALTVTDAIFQQDGKLAYDDNEFSGLWGDVILVNGRPWPTMKVQRRIYRFRVLNASIARSYRFHLSDNSPMTIVGTDGGLIQNPVTVTEWRHGGAERYEVLIDFRKYAPGQTVELRNRSNRNNVDYDHTGKVLRFQVTDVPVNTADKTWNTIPTQLFTTSALRSDIMRIPANQAIRTRRFELDHDDETNVFKINNRTWEDVQNSGYQDVLADVGINEVEIWEFANNSGGWFHPLHIHLVDFRILSRNGRAPFAYENGPKDVVYIGEDETVKLLIKFAVTPGSAGGKYMVHCHNLPHEDHDMMQQFCVGDDQANDPIASAPPRWDDGNYDDGRRL